MWFNRTLSIIGAIIISLCIGLVCYAQPSIPSERIPDNIPADVKLEIKNLYSTDPQKQAYAMITLEKMGERASSAIPFLIATFNNSWHVQLQSKGTLFITYENTFTGELAADALAGIGKSSIEPLISCLKDINSNPRGYSAKALGKIGNIRAIAPLINALDYANKNEKVDWVVQNTVNALKEITGKYFGTDPDRWHQWWQENKDNYKKNR